VQEIGPASLDDYLIMEAWGLDKYWDAAWSED